MWCWLEATIRRWTDHLPQSMHRGPFLGHPRGPPEGPSRGLSQGPPRGPFQDPRAGPSRGPPPGPFQGPPRGLPQGPPQRPFQGPPKRPGPGVPPMTPQLPPHTMGMAREHQTGSRIVQDFDFGPERSPSDVSNNTTREPDAGVDIDMRDKRHSWRDKDEPSEGVDPRQHDDDLFKNQEPNYRRQRDYDQEGRRDQHHDKQRHYDDRRDEGHRRTDHDRHSEDIRHEYRNDCRDDSKDQEYGHRDPTKCRMKSSRLPRQPSEHQRYALFDVLML